MNIKEMHYDFKLKLNKIDSQQYRNLLVPEIDWILNEALELFIKRVAKPRTRSHLGFEVRQRNIDDIRTIVINNDQTPVNDIIVTNNIALLPQDYWHFIRGYAKLSKGSCTDVRARLMIRQHDDTFQESPFDSSSFDWRIINALFYEGGIKLYGGDDFSIDKICLSYIRRPLYIHNAEDFTVGNYLIPGTATPLTGFQNCELPEHTHREIVDIAVMIASNQIQASDYNIKAEKIRLNDLI